MRLTSIRTRLILETSLSWRWSCSVFFLGRPRVGPGLCLGNDDRRWCKEPTGCSGHWRAVNRPAITFRLWTATGSVWCDSTTPRRLVNGMANSSKSNCRQWDAVGFGEGSARQARLLDRAR